MTKFETIGVQYQQESCSKEEANDRFNYSCRCCSNRGMRISCDGCGISVAHAMTIALLDDLAAMKEQRECCKCDHQA